VFKLKFLIVNQKYTFVLKRICLFDKAATANDSKNMKSREKNLKLIKLKNKNLNFGISKNTLQLL